MMKVVVAFVVLFGLIAWAEGFANGGTGRGQVFRRKMPGSGGSNLVITSKVMKGRQRRQAAESSDAASTTMTASTENSSASASSSEQGQSQGGASGNQGGSQERFSSEQEAASTTGASTGTEDQSASTIEASSGGEDQSASTTQASAEVSQASDQSQANTNDQETRASSRALDSNSKSAASQHKVQPKASSQSQKSASSLRSSSLKSSQQASSGSQQVSALPAIQYPNANYEDSGPAPAQADLLDALDRLRGKSAPAANADLTELLASAVPGKDFPNLAEIPEAGANYCSTVQQAGFYADERTDCQVIRRCDVNGLLTSYLCPNLTRFNQIMLICDWFWNVDCSQSKQFADFSNSRLYHASWAFLDTPAARQDAAAASESSGSADQSASQAVPAQKTAPATATSAGSRGSSIRSSSSKSSSQRSSSSNTQA